MKPSRISVVCVTHQRPQLLERALGSCFQQDTKVDEIFVVVNGFDGVTREILTKKFPDVQFIQTHKNIGAFPAKNLAIANVTGDYVFTLDDDAYFESTDVLTRLVSALEKSPDVAIVQCNILGEHEVTYEGNDRDIPIYKDGFVLVRREVYTDWVGYYPDLFFRSGSETFISQRLWDLGYRVRLVVDARMHHDLAMTGRSTRDWWFYGIRSQVLCSLMRDPGILLLPIITSKFVKSLYQAAKSAKLSVWFQAWLSVICCIPYAFSQRKPIRLETYLMLKRLSKAA